MNTRYQTSVWTFLQDGSAIKTKLQAKELHARLIRTIEPISATLCSKSLSIYLNFDLLEYSLSLFSTLDSPQPTKAWKSIVKCYASRDHFLSSVASFMEMRAVGSILDSNVFPSVLKFCVYLRDSALGESVHGCIISLGLHSDLCTGNSLMNTSEKLQLSGSDLIVFDKSSERKEGMVSFRSNLQGFDNSDEFNQNLDGVELSNERPT